MSNPLPDEFDGTWRFANEAEADGWNYLHFSNGNRITQFYNIKEGNFEDAKMLVKDIGNATIEFFPRDGSDGWTRGYRFDDGNLVIVEGESEYPCQRPPEVPGWLQQGIEDALLYFEENEPKWGTSE